MVSVLIILPHAIRNHSIGLGLLNPRGWKNIVQCRIGRPILNLDFLLKRVVQELVPLDWSRFWKNQQQIPLKVGHSKGVEVVIWSLAILIYHFLCIRW